MSNSRYILQPQLTGQAMITTDHILKKKKKKKKNGKTYGIQISSSLKISNKNILKNILEI